MVKAKPARSPSFLPATPEAWLQEIARAFLDAAETIAVGPLLDVDIKEGALFHMAPQVCVKFRGIRPTKRTVKRATGAALTSYFATTSRDPESLSKPHLAFAFCYLTSHFGIDLLSEAEVADLMDFIVEHETELGNAIRKAARSR